MSPAQLKAIIDHYQGRDAVVSVGIVDVPGIIDGHGTASIDGKDTDCLLLTDPIVPSIQTWVPARLITGIHLDLELS